MSIKEQIRAEIERIRSEAVMASFGNETSWLRSRVATCVDILSFLDTIPEQPVSDHHEIEVEFRGEKVTINREFYRDGEMNYSTSEQDDNAIWSALRAWCEKKGITPFELYPKLPEDAVEGVAEELYNDGESQCTVGVGTYFKPGEEVYVIKRGGTDK